MTKMVIILFAIAATVGSASNTQAQVTAMDETTPAWCAANAASLGSVLFHNSNSDNKAMIDLIMRKDRTPAEDDQVEHLRGLTAWADDDSDALDERYPDANYDADAAAVFAAMDHDALVAKADACLS